MSKQIKYQPKWVREIVFERQKEQGNEPNDENYLSNLKECDNFDWHDTKESCHIWQETNEGNYQPLADFHGIAIDENGNQTTPTTKDPVDGYGGC